MMRAQSGGTHDMGGKSYKVVHQNRDEIIVEAEFDNYPDAAVHLANSIFLGDYLTSEGQPGADDLAMIADAGFTVEGRDERTLPAARHDLVAVRRRGAGTDLPANT